MWIQLSVVGKDLGNWAPIVGCVCALPRGCRIKIGEVVNDGECRIISGFGRDFMAMPSEVAEILQG